MIHLRCMTTRKGLQPDTIIHATGGLSTSYSIFERLWNVQNGSFHPVAPVHDYIMRWAARLRPPRHCRADSRVEGVRRAARSHCWRGTVRGPARADSRAQLWL